MKTFLDWEKYLPHTMFAGGLCTKQLGRLLRTKARQGWLVLVFVAVLPAVPAFSGGLPPGSTALSPTPLQLPSPSSSDSTAPSLPGAISTALPVNELTLKVGILPDTALTNALIGLLAYGFPQEIPYIFFLPAITIQYFRDWDSSISLGGTASYNIPVMNLDGSISSHTLAFLYNCRLTYQQKGYTRLYGKAGLGIKLVIAPESSPYVVPALAFNFIPFGIQFGGQTLFGTAEIAFGVEGSFLTLGGGFRF